MNFRILGVLAIGLSFIGSARAQAPSVARATPDNADIGVDPALTAITIEFDMDMSESGHSICGGGPQFPVITGRPMWKNARTIEVPVKLEPGKTYALSVNCPSGQKFRNLAGDPAIPHSISFRTRSEGEAPPPPLGEGCAAAIESLRAALDERYSHKEIKGVDWNAELELLKSKVRAEWTSADLARAMAASLAKADDLHITMTVNGFTLGTARRSVRANMDLKSLTKIVKNWKQHNARIATGEYGGVPYIMIGDWSGPASDYEPAFEFLKTNASAPAMIVDVRANSGGDELLARSVASCFVKKQAVYARNKTRTPDAPGGWTDTFDRVVEPDPDRPAITSRVCVLMGRANMSSNESFLCMMRYGAGARLFGETSYGSSGNPKPCKINKDITINLPSWIDMTPDDALVEGVGIKPDEMVEWSPPVAGMSAPDTVLGAGWHWVSNP